MGPLKTSSLLKAPARLLKEMLPEGWEYSNKAMGGSSKGCYYQKSAGFHTPFSVKRLDNNPSGVRPGDPKKWVPLSRYRTRALERRAPYAKLTKDAINKICLKAKKVINPRDNWRLPLQKKLMKEESYSVNFYPLAASKSW